MRKVGRPKNPLSRERLLDAAAAQFARGYHAASMADIARACGIHKSSLFHHFASKEALYLEVVGDYIGRLGALVLAATGPGDFLGRLDRLGEVVTDFLGEHPHAAALLLRELMDEGPYVRLVGLDGVRHVVRMVSGFLAAGMAEGVIAPQDPRQLALSICGVHLTWFATGRVTSEVLEDDVFSPSQVAARKAAVTTQIRRICGVARPGSKG